MSNNKMNTLDYIINKYQLPEDSSFSTRVDIPNVGRDDIPALLHELDFKKIVEVGVQGGHYSETLVHGNPQAMVYGVDPWEGYVTHPTEEGLKTDKADSSKARCIKFYEQTKKRMAKYSNYIIIKKTSMDALGDFDDESLDFVYIDGNHEYEYVMDDIEGWSKKIKKGGIIAGHDFYKVRNKGSLMHVKYAVSDYLRYNKGIGPLLIWGKDGVPPEITKRDRRRSWSWVI